MQQETLEEAADKFSKQLSEVVAFYMGAKWQAERMYSEEYMQEYAEFCIICYQKGLPCIIAQDWFKLYKKK
jgi:hypothetical protein